MSATEESINKLLRDSVNLILSSASYSIRGEEPNAPRPIGPYCAVTKFTGRGIGWEQSSHVKSGAENVSMTLEGLKEVAYSIIFYRTNAEDNAEKVRIGLLRDSVKELFNESEVALIRRSDVRNISAPLEDAYETAYQIDVFLSLIGSDIETVAAINAVEVEGEYQDNGRTVDIEINVP